MKQPAVYMMTNKNKTTLYTGVTSNLLQRVYQHKNGLLKGFTKRYNCHYLVYYESFDTMDYAIAREKQIKCGSRADKDHLIHTMNPDWKDLYETII